FSTFERVAWGSLYVGFDTRVFPVCPGDRIDRGGGRYKDKKTIAGRKLASRVGRARAGFPDHNRPFGSLQSVGRRFGGGGRPPADEDVERDIGPRIRIRLLGALALDRVAVMKGVVEVNPGRGERADQITHHVGRAAAVV